MADWKRFWPEPEQNERDFVELFAMDIFAGDKIHGLVNRRQFRIPLLLFHKVLRVQMSLMRVQEKGCKLSRAVVMCYEPLHGPLVISRDGSVG